MSSKKSARTTGRSGSAEKELQAALSAATAQLARSEKKLAKATDRADRWKAEAKVQAGAASAAVAKSAKLQRKLDRAAADLAAERSREVALEVDAPSTPEPAPTAASHPVVDESWSVVQLRAEARSRGLVGLSNKPKAEIIAALV